MGDMSIFGIFIDISVYRVDEMNINGRYVDIMAFYRHI